MNTVLNDGVGICHGDRQADPVQHRDVDPVIAGITDILFIHTGIMKAIRRKR